MQKKSEVIGGGKTMPKSSKSFWNIAKANAEEVKTWPKWKQKIVITAKTAETGQFRMSEKEWKERYG